MITNELILALIQTVSLYCGSQGPGTQIELYQYGKWSGERDSAASCFKKIWICGHDTTDASVLVSSTHNCISKHVRGELK